MNVFHQARRPAAALVIIGAAFGLSATTARTGMGDAVFRLALIGVLVASGMALVSLRRRADDIDLDTAERRHELR